MAKRDDYASRRNTPNRAICILRLYARAVLHILDKYLIFIFPFVNTEEQIYIYMYIFPVSDENFHRRSLRTSELDRVLYVPAYDKRLWRREEDRKRRRRRRETIAIWRCGPFNLPSLTKKKKEERERGRKERGKNSHWPIDGGGCAS